jgi:hypothetical protein
MKRWVRRRARRTARPVRTKRNAGERNADERNAVLISAAEEARTGKAIVLTRHAM